MHRSRLQLRLQIAPKRTGHLRSRARRSYDRFVDRLRRGFRGPRPARRHQPRLACLAVAAATLAGALAGCGSSPSQGTSADPATVVPASAPLYLGAVVRPGGSLKAAALAAGRKLTHQADPYLRLVGLLQSPGSGTPSFAKDVAPWLGSRAGIFFETLPSSGTLQMLLGQGLLGGGGASAGAWPFAERGQEGALVLDTSDPTRARSFLNAQALRAGAHATSYRGVAYQASADGRAAFALLHRLAVLGSDAGVRGVIDTAQGAPALARAPGYSKLLAAAPSGALAHLYANPAPPAGSSAAAAGAKGSGSSVLQLLGGARLLDVSLVPAAGSVALDVDALSTGPAGSSSAQAGGLLAASARGAQTLSQLPGESWLAAGLGNVGGALGSGLQGLRGLISLASAFGGSGASAPSSTGVTLSVKGLIEGLLKPLDALTSSSAQARADFLSWMGDAGVFASGSSLLELKAAVVIASKDPARSRAAVGKLASLLRKAGGETQSVSPPGAEAAVTAKLTGLPATLAIADGRNANGQAEFVLGIGEASVQDALRPASTLAGASSLGTASSLLGEGLQPSLIFSVPTFLGLLEGVGLGEDPTIGPAVPYLRSLSTVAGGGGSLGGGIERLRLVFGLQPGA
jgi:Protein of unknown function (DUF3352)